MADTNTIHLNLIKQDPDSIPDYAKDHTNLETIDSEVWARGKTFNGTPVDPTDGGFHITTIPNAENLESSASQSSTMEYVVRSSGGSAPVQTGSAWLSNIKGARRHEGYVEESVDMQAALAERSGEEPDVSIDNATFVAYVQQTSGTITFVYSNAWKVGNDTVDITNYGIDFDGTPVAGDTITVVYQKEVRGTIIHCTPATFVSTGWNLYNHTSGYARVVKYSDEYGYKVSGTYATLEFAETLDGERERIYPASGFFTVPTDGYLFVSGGNTTDTAIWMTWSDWVNGYKWNSSTGTQGTFETYSETVVDLSSFMNTNFPSGLMQVGNVRDEINLNVGSALSKVMRMVYNSTNLATAISSGREYEYDENYIYLERETPVSFTISIDGGYDVNDHGIEMFIGTDQDVLAQTLYGMNLRNEIETNMLKKSQQDLSATEQAQVQENIGVTELFNQLLNLYMVEGKSIFDNKSIASGGFTDDTVSIAKTGYVPVGVVGHSYASATTSGTGRSYAVASKMYISGNNLVSCTRNVSATANIKIRLTAYILYKKVLQ